MKMGIIFLVVFCREIWGLRIRRSDVEELDLRGDLFITISGINKFKMELYWNLTQKVDEIRLYLQQPPFDETVKPRYIIDPIEKAAYFVTNDSISLSKVPFVWQKDSPGFNITRGPINLDYCVAAVMNKQILKTNCLKIQPTWMSDNGGTMGFTNHATHSGLNHKPVEDNPTDLTGDVIGDIPLTELFIPGTHNSGCYGDNPENDVKDPILKFVYTQDVDVWTQLVSGIRYLDVRVGYYNTTFVRDSFWVNHDKFRVNLLKDFFHELKRFLTRAKDEIVILDLHRFPVGFKNPNRHKQLTDLIDKELKDIAIPRSYQNPPKGPTLNEIWEQKGRLIICYGDQNTAANSEYLWDPLTQKWGNKQSISELKKYLLEIRSSHVSKNSNKLWASMAELTATPSSIFEGLISTKSHFKSIAHMSDHANRNLNIWYRYNPCNVNIVATDFFLGNDLINIAIECNLRNGKY